MEAVVGFPHIMKQVNRAGFHDIIEGYQLSVIIKPVEPFEYVNHVLVCKRQPRVGVLYSAAVQRQTAETVEP